MCPLYYRSEDTGENVSSQATGLAEFEGLHRGLFTLFHPSVHPDVLWHSCGKLSLIFWIYCALRASASCIFVFLVSSRVTGLRKVSVNVWWMGEWMNAEIGHQDITDDLQLQLSFPLLLPHWPEGRGVVEWLRILPFTSIKSCIAFNILSPSPGLLCFLWKVTPEPLWGNSATVLLSVPSLFLPVT